MDSLDLLAKLPCKIPVEAYVGYRIWEVTQDGRLYAVLHDFEWPMRQPAEAPTLVPSGILNEGFHAFATAQSAWNAFDETCDEAPHLYLALGSVALWGDVTFENDGNAMRATRAYPLSLWTTYDPEANAFIATAGQRYGVDVFACPLFARAEVA
jgi:hypothetical protein